MKYLHFILIFTTIVLAGSTASAQKPAKKDRRVDKTQTPADSTAAAKDATFIFGNDELEDVSGFSEINDMQEDESGYSSSPMPGLLHSSQDVFSRNSSYTFSIAYFRARGYDGKYSDVFMNGFSMNSSVTGRATYSQWGGLNQIFRYPEYITNMDAAGFAFGNIGGAGNYNICASNFRRQARASYSLTNRTYNNRIMLTGATGVMKNGWSVAGSLSARFGDGISYVEGTSYNSFAGFVAVEKIFNSAHRLNLSAFANYTSRGMQSSSVQEAYDLLNDNYYNANWGWYQGKQRNARVRTVCEPVILLTHSYAPKDNRLRVNSTLAATFGRNSTTSLNWYDAPDPRPDYYRYLPSYQISNGDTADYYGEIRRLWSGNDQSYTQINWDRLYEVNQLAAAQGKRAQYMVENRVRDHILLGGASHLSYSFTKYARLYAGLDVRGMKQENYKTINDLLGGSYWLDVDKFSEGDFPEDQQVQYNDLLHKNDTLHEGDIFGYNYDYHIYTQRLWATAVFSFPHIDFHIGGQVGGTEFWRTGQMQNGRYQNNSLGNSEKKAFLEGAAKAGLTYKITGRNYLVLNGQFGSSAPSVMNAFVSPRIQNGYVENLSNENIYSADLSYVFNHPVIKLRVSAFFTQMQDINKLISFYHDDFSSMVNYSVSGIDQRHYGIELGSEIKLGSMFSLILAGTYGDYRYSDQASVVMIAENGTDFEDEIQRTVYWKNFHVAGTPQAASTIGLKFNHNYWWVTVNANYFDKIYCDLNPERRTSAARGSLDADTELYHQIADQTRMKGQFTLDLSVSKSWKIKRYLIGINASVTNLLNNKNLITTAYEQYRFDYYSYNPNKYANKYYYAFGTTFYIGLNFTFN